MGHQLPTTQDILEKIFDDFNAYTDSKVITIAGNICREGRRGPRATHYILMIYEFKIDVTLQNNGVHVKLFDTSREEASEVVYSAHEDTGNILVNGLNNDDAQLLAYWFCISYIIDTSKLDAEILLGDAIMGMLDAFVGGV